MTTYSFRNGKNYPTISVRLSVDFGTYDTPAAEIVISEGGTELHRDDAIIVDSGGKVRYDLDGVDEELVEETEYELQFDVFDGGIHQATLPATPHTLVVQPGDAPSGGGGDGGSTLQTVDVDRVSADSISTQSLSAGSATMGSMQTDELNNTYRFVPGDGNNAGDINSAIDTLHSNGGGTVVLERGGTYDITATTGEVELNSNVTLDGNWATIQYADGLNDNAPPNGMVRFDPMESGGCENAEIRRVRVDANLDNNTFTARRYREGIQVHPLNIAQGGGIESEGTRPLNCVVKDCVVVHSVASCLQMSGRGTYVNNVSVGGSADDHLFYDNRGIDQTIENIHMSGFGGGSCITISTTDEYGDDMHGNVYRNFTISNLQWDLPHGQVSGRTGLTSIIDARQTARLTGGYTARDNVIENLTVEAEDANPSAGDTPWALIQNQLSIKGVKYRGATAETTGIFRFTGSSSGAEISDAEITVTGMPTGATVRGISVGGMSDISVDNVHIKDNTSEGIRGVVARPEDTDCHALSLTNIRLDVGSVGIRIDEDSGTGTISELGVGAIQAENGNLFGITGTPTYAHGTMLPQDVRGTAPWFEGRMNYHNGDGTDNTAGVAVRIGSEWISQVDGSVIS